MKKIYIIILIVIVGAVIYMFLPQITNAPTKNIQPTTIQNTSIPTTGDLTLSVGQKGTLGDLSIMWNEPLQDSRCPIGVQCIWAGELQINVTMKIGGYSETRTMFSSKPGYLFDGHKISITAITPQAKQESKLAPTDYKITFHVEATNDKN